MLLSAVSVLVVAHSSSEIPEGLMNNPAYVCVWNVAKNVYTVLDANNTWSSAKLSEYIQGYS